VSYSIYTWLPSYPLIKIPTFDTKIIEYNTGVEQRIKRHNEVKFKFKIQHDHITQVEMEEIANFFITCRGAYSPFWFKDLSLSITSNQIGTGTNSATAFQLIRSFGDYEKNVIKVDSSMFTVWLDDVLQSAPTDFTLNNSGVVTFASAPSSGAVITATHDFYFLVRFAVDAVNYEYFLHQLFNQRSVEFIEIIGE